MYKKENRRDKSKLKKNQTALGVSKERKKNANEPMPRIQKIQEKNAETLELKLLDQGKKQGKKNEDKKRTKQKQCNDRIVFKKDVEEVNEDKEMNWEIQQSNMRKREEVKQLEAKIESSSIKQREFFKNNASEVKIYATKMDLFACEKGNIKKTLAILEQEELFEPAHLFTTNKGLIFIFQKEQAIEILNIVFSSISKYMLSGNFFLLSFDGKKQRESLAVKIEKDQEIKKWFEFIKVNMELIHSPQVSRVSKWCDIGLKSKLSNDSESGKESPSQNYLNRKQKSKEKKEEMPKNKLIQGSLIKQERESDAVESNRKGSESISKKPTGISMNKREHKQNKMQNHPSLFSEKKQYKSSQNKKIQDLKRKQLQLLKSPCDNYWTNLHTSSQAHNNLLQVQSSYKRNNHTQYKQQNFIAEDIRRKNMTNHYKYGRGRVESNCSDVETISLQSKQKIRNRCLDISDNEIRKRQKNSQSLSKKPKKNLYKQLQEGLLKLKLNTSNDIPLSENLQKKDDNSERNQEQNNQKKSQESSQEEDLHILELKNGIVLQKCSPNGWQPHEKRLFLSEDQQLLYCKDVKTNVEKKIFLGDIHDIQYKNYGMGVSKHKKNIFKPEYCMTIDHRDGNKLKTMEFICDSKQVGHLANYCEYLKKFLNKKFGNEEKE